MNSTPAPHVLVENIFKPLVASKKEIKMEDIRWRWLHANSDLSFTHAIGRQDVADRTKRMKFDSSFGLDTCLGSASVFHSVPPVFCHGHVGPRSRGTTVWQLHAGPYP